MTLMVLMTMLVKHVAVCHFSDCNGISLDDDDDDYHHKYHIGNVDNSVMITITTAIL